MAGVAIRLVVAGVLAAAAVAKLASPRSSRAALATFAITGERVQTVAWALVVAAELGLAAGVAAGSDTAAWLAAGLTAMFAATLVSAILRGRAGAPCACFGSRSRVGWGAVGRNAVLAAGFVAAALVPQRGLATDEWLGLGLGLALLACLALAVAVLALAREVGMLRLRLGPDSALEVPEEGPPLGVRSPLAERFDPGPRAELMLAVFGSGACRVCRALEPAVAALAAEPLVAVESFDEVADADAWREADVPGSPFAVALGRDGTVLAKGTFNNLAQLESVLAAAERRRAPVSVGGGAGG